ncbi:MAG: hypothetical protein HYS08_07585 [Chlamydiae bacterium]|nr:hypothetical protein [Chlamydiota bacterium]MBI3266357.1 hypothetical protein [Chlamydiota bacterium]
MKRWEKTYQILMPIIMIGLMIECTFIALYNRRLKQEILTLWEETHSSPNEVKQSFYDEKSVENHPDFGKPDAAFS